MWIKHSLITGLLLLACFVITVESARRNKARASVARNNARSDARNAAQNFPTPRTTLNVGGLSDAIMDAVRPTINDIAAGINLPRNTNSRGNGNGRQVNSRPAEPAELNLTVVDIMRQYPWIENPQAIVDSTNSASRSGAPDISDNGPQPSTRITETTTEQPRFRPNSRRNDGRTRFNNPKYLRDQLDGLDRDDYDFTVTQGVKTANGTYKVKLLQDWRRLPIYGNALVFEQEEDANMILETADGEFLSGIEDDINSELPTLTSDQALERALAHNQDQGKPIQNPTAKLIVDTIGEKAVLAYMINYFVPGSELPQDPITAQPPVPTQAPFSTSTDFYSIQRQNRQIRRQRRRCRRRRTRAGRARCMADISATTTTNRPPAVQDPSPTFEATNHGLKRPWLLMNANSGEVYKAWNGLTAYIRPNRVPIRTGNPVYNFQEYTEIMYKDSELDACYYQKPIGGGKFLRVNDKTTSNTANVYKFRCSDGVRLTYDATNGAASTRNSAFKWGGEAINFLKRISSSKWDFDVNIETHHSGIHAVWNGNAVQLGDGDPTFFYPLTTPDTVTHEVSHAFTEHNSNLEYQHQSGAINEAFSDMAASAFLDHFFKYPEHLVYKIGRTALKFNTAIRDLCNPGSNSLLLYDPNKPIIESALDYNTQTGLHNASSLYSKAFCDLSKTPGWSIQQAFKVFTNANAVYWIPTETFNSGACGVKKAAWDYKNTLQAVRDVDNAFKGVDIACDQRDWYNLEKAL